MDGLEREFEFLNILAELGDEGDHGNVIVLRVANRLVARQDRVLQSAAQQH